MGVDRRDLSPNGREIPAQFEVPMEQVRAVEVAFLEREELPAPQGAPSQNM